MKVSGMSVLWLVLGIALLLLLASGSSTTSWSTSEVLTDTSGTITAAATGRKLQSSCSKCADGKTDGHEVHLEDYGQPVDPVPSSKTSIRPGPIQHGSPLNPYIPKPPPPPSPAHSKVGGSP